MTTSVRNHMLLLCAAVLLGIFFYNCPQMDLVTSGWFYDHTQQFYLSHEPIVVFMHKLVPLLAVLYVVGCFGWMLLIFWRTRVGAVDMYRAGDVGARKARYKENSAGCMVDTANEFDAAASLPSSNPPGQGLFGLLASAKSWLVYTIQAALFPSLLSQISRWQRRRATCRYHLALKAYVPAIYLLAALALGPGVMVHYVMKDQFQRARPLHSVEFGGQYTFTPAFVVASECTHNCSFVSGHASMGFAFYAFAFIAPWANRRSLILAASTIMGSIFGLGRIIEGGHFLSDVVFAGFVVYFTCYGLALLFVKFLNMEKV